MHVEDIAIFHLKGICWSLLIVGREGREGWSVLQKMAASVLQDVLLTGRSQEGFHVCCPWWVLSY